jgi:hypothetical protein
VQFNGNPQRLAHLKISELLFLKSVYSYCTVSGRVAKAGVK